ncbi:protein phosphatase 1 regulatory subunit 1A [Trachemys scripta elegans]|uniref:protein phosphatase 1 regulatory subunit 1A n=1 Tax=Trachemys scripta elegans TaxID=31138 RepID=UPI0015547A78|nr:protein phosphatase 1 regulatory subunit 1A [Trachemys scripta elegans]
MEPNSPRKIQFTVPLLEPHLDPEAAEQIRRRRPTPATLVLSSDQSSPGEICSQRMICRNDLQDSGDPGKLVSFLRPGPASGWNLQSPGPYARVLSRHTNPTPSPTGSKTCSPLTGAPAPGQPMGLGKGSWL